MTQAFDSFVQNIIKESGDSEDIELRGEYWFDENGNAQYADGDVGDMNHEAHVIARCGYQVANYFGLDEFDENAIINEISDEVGDEWGDIENDPADAIIKYLVTFFKMPEDKASELVLTAYGSTNDARDYAIKNWNWIRVHGTNIEVNKLNAQTLKKVAEGIGDALEQEGNMYEDDSYERAGKVEYIISTYTGKRYTITLDNMEAGSVSGLEEDVPVKVSAATKQVRDMDVAQMPDYYRKKGIIGDSSEFDQFINIIFENKDI
jgi:hypothetical protein